MLELSQCQAAGLQGLASSGRSARVLLTCSHGSQLGERPMLWAWCSAWLDAGESVVVLDGYVTETETNPGLLQRLDGAAATEHWCADASWCVWPARLGLAHMLRTGISLQSLHAWLPAAPVVLVYAPVDTALALSVASHALSVLILGASHDARLSAYAALKAYAAAGQRLPVVVKIAPAKGPTDGAPDGDGLARCVQRFLKQEPSVYTVHAPASPAQVSEDIHRLALLLWEQAADTPQPSNHRLH